MKRHVVRQGEDIVSIASRSGLHWKTIWNHSASVELKSQREDPNILLPGDVVQIPEIVRRWESAASESKHTYRKLGSQSKLNLVIKIRNSEGDEEICANEPYIIEFQGANAIEGTTLEDGSLCVSMPPKATRGYLRIEALKVVIPLDFAYLDPISSTTGIQARLNSLGFSCGQVDGISGPLTKAGIEAFQRHHDLMVDGIAGPQTQRKLKSEFGS